MFSQYSARLERDLVSVLLSRSANLLLRQNHKVLICAELTIRFIYTDLDHRPASFYKVSELAAVFCKYANFLKNKCI